ncbi:MAG: P1 family peptidase [Lachnospiraceae bacterium]|nr:P1 family peptidase [Lachnospiraceae bacterium]
MSCRRIRDYGIGIGSFPTGERNSIGDIPGVSVGHCTIDTERHKTGVTVILPCEGNMFAGKLAAASYVLNGFGKTAGTIQINELGTLESPIALTNTLNVGLVQDALVSYMVERCQEEGVPLFSFNPVVGECNDCHLNDIKERAVNTSHVFSAISSASADFEQGDVGAGKGTICFGLKGGIGSSSRRIEIDGKTYHIGVLVQSNFGKMEDLVIQGMEIGRTIRKWQEEEKKKCPKADDEGSIMSIIATDLPLSSRQLHRILRRAAMGLGRTGSHVGHGSGDVMIGFSTANVISGASGDGESFSHIQILHESLMDIPFRAVIEAEEEAILNSLAAADSVTGYTEETCHALDPYLKRYLELQKQQ